MKLNALKEDVKRLMFVDSIESEEAFFCAVNRAVFRTRSAFPKKKRVKTVNYPLQNVLCEKPETVYRISGEKTFYGEDVASYYFEGEGMGKADFYYFNAEKSVDDYELLLSVEINSPRVFKKYRGFVKRFGAFARGKFKVVLHGDYTFAVKNFALYDSLLSPEESDIPDFCEKAEIKLEKATECVGKEQGALSVRSDFLSLSEPIRLIDGGKRTEIPYELVGKRLFVSREDVGEIEIVYVAVPETCGVASGEEDEVDFPDEVAPFASYLVAANLMLEEDPEISAEYFTRYVEAETYAKALYSIKSGVYEYTGGAF